MGTLIVEMKATDFAKAMANFEKGAPIRKEAGITNSRVFRSVADPNAFVVISDAADEAKARAALANPQVRTMMQEAGALGPPKIQFIG